MRLTDIDGRPDGKVEGRNCKIALPINVYSFFVIYWLIFFIDLSTFLPIPLLPK